MFKCIATLVFNGERFTSGEKFEKKALKGIPEEFLNAHFREEAEEEVEEETEEETSETETEDAPAPTRRRRSN